jgi:short-subunit dehydrogenase
MIGSMHYSINLVVVSVFGIILLHNNHVSFINAFTIVGSNLVANNKLPFIQFTNRHRSSPVQHYHSYASPILTSKPSSSSFSTTSLQISSLNDFIASLTSPSYDKGRGGVVITGGANGVGYAYACEFIKRGYDVVICDVKDCTSAAQSIERKYAGLRSSTKIGKIYHTKCDVSNPQDVIALGSFASDKLNNYIQYWINNAGINGGRKEFRDVSIQTVEAVVRVNLLGVLYCTKVAMDIMSNQQKNKLGHIFNTVGSGVKGGGTPGYASYGVTKRGLPQLTASLGTNEETKYIHRAHFAFFVLFGYMPFLIVSCRFLHLIRICFFINFSLSLHLILLT